MSIRSIRLGVGAAIALAAAATAAAQDYYAHAFPQGDLVRVDLGNGQVTTLGNSGFTPGDIAFNRAPVPSNNGTYPAGTLFGVSQSGILYTLDINNGQSAQIGSLGTGTESLTFDLNNNLLTVLQDGSNRVLRVSTVNGSTQQIGVLSGQPAPYDGLTVAPRDVQVQGFGTVPAGSLFGCDSGALYWIDRNTFQSNLIAQGTSANETLTFDPATGELYVHDFDGAIFRYDLATLTETFLYDTPAGIVGSAIIPAPSAAAAFALAGLAAARRRR